MAPYTEMTGMLGIYLVAAELTSRDFIVAPTPSSAHGVDLLVTDQRCRKAWTVQVTTNRRAANVWTLGARAQEIESDSHVHIFVNMRGDKRPYYYVVPGRTAAGQMRTISGKGGSSLYEFPREVAEEYIENWVLFGPPT